MTRACRSQRGEALERSSPACATTRATQLASQPLECRRRLSFGALLPKCVDPEALERTLASHRLLCQPTLLSRTPVAWVPMTRDHHRCRSASTTLRPVIRIARAARIQHSAGTHPPIKTHDGAHTNAPLLPRHLTTILAATTAAEELAGRALADCVQARSDAGGIVA